MTINIFQFIQSFHKFLLHICQMFQKLKQHWKVNGLNLILIITTFALGGSLCGYAGRKLLALTSLDKGVLWVLLYIILVTLLWPVAVLLVSIPLGQFSFFKRYIGKVFRRFTKQPHLSSPPAGGREMEKIGVEKMQPLLSSPKGREKEEIKAKNGIHTAPIINVAIFASGGGSNAQQIINYFSSSPVKIALIVCNKPGAGVLQVAAKAGIPSLLMEKEQFFNGDNYLQALQKHHIDFIVLAGFLWKIPEALISAYPKKIINIHPALLPKYGGSGMYGRHVHEAVISNKEKQSGITIHYVDELYDHGEIIFQATCAVEENDTVETLARKVQGLEHTHYGRVIEGVVASK
jgi:formyltetrahydrofolate-dependent phosphoribosylglycinamide formyltransferase